MLCPKTTRALLLIDICLDLSVDMQRSRQEEMHYTPQLGAFT